ncbi:MAG: RNA polymerase sigma factor [Actinomycetia bacterium]|nr:RNA polymerase sigma factor [Actinomycetes bacterium]
MEDAMFAAAISTELPRLHRLARRVACITTDPDDLVQDTLERAWRSRDRFRAESTAATWLHRILVNRAIDLCRRAGQNALTGLDTIDDEHLLDLGIDDPVAVIAAAEDTARLRVALSRLAPDERMVLVLHDGEGWSARDPLRRVSRPVRSRRYCCATHRGRGPATIGSATTRGGRSHRVGFTSAR